MVACISGYSECRPGVLLEIKHILCAATDWPPVHGVHHLCPAVPGTSSSNLLIPKGIKLVMEMDGWMDIIQSTGVVIAWLWVLEIAKSAGKMTTGSVVVCLTVSK